MIKLFTHNADPDGLGSAILLDLISQDTSLTLCKGIKELDQKLIVFINEKEYQQFDNIYITDLCPSNEVLELIASCSELKHKILIFDHHQTSLNMITKDYEFLTLKVKKDGIPCCGTSLFYEYLLKQLKAKLLTKKIVSDFVEKTRLHDTWEWVINNDLDAFNLQTLFQVLGCYGYKYHMANKLQNENEFIYTDNEKQMIKEQKIQNQEQLKALANDIYNISYNGLKIAAVFGNYNIRNNLAEYLTQNKPEFDILMLIAADNKTVSFRSLKSIVEVRSLAEKFGGGGHQKAAACPLKNIEPLMLERILK